MTQENLIFYEPTEAQLQKFRDINASPNWPEQCVYYDDCTVCPMAIHQYLLSTTKHICTYGISEEKFRLLMSDADCEY